MSEPNIFVLILFLMTRLQLLFEKYDDSDLWKIFDLLHDFLISVQACKAIHSSSQFSGALCAQRSN